MKPIIHSRNSVKMFGGVISDYLYLHDWMDSTKAAYANFAHRAILHNTFGIYLGEQLFGTTIINSDGKEISVRDILEMHVKEDCGGRIPTLQDWLGKLEPEPWMLGRGMKKYVESINMEMD